MYFKIEALRNAYSSTNYVRYYYMDINLDINYADFSSSNPYTYSLFFHQTRNILKAKENTRENILLLKNKVSNSVLPLLEII